METLNIVMSSSEDLPEELVGKLEKFSQSVSNIEETLSKYMKIPLSDFKEKVPKNRFCKISNQIY